jgi:glycosyltransferase involved in cell wall biosynthesis
MKVLMTTDTVGGVWTYALELIAALPDVQFVLATQGPLPSIAQRVEAASLPNLVLECRCARLEWQDDCAGDLADTRAWLRALAALHEPDLVHLNDYANATPPWPVPVLLVLHSCVCSWWLAVHGSLPPAEWRAYRDRVESAIHQADVVVAPSRAYLEQMQGVYGAMKCARVVHNARDPNLFPEWRGERVARVMSAGRLWDEAKNLRTLDVAAAGLPQPVLVAGETSAPHGGGARFATAVAMGKLSPADLRICLQRSAIYAAPAVYEPFGLSVLEAALAGCALVLGDIPTLRELWDGAAEFVPAREPRMWRRALSRLLKDGARCHELATRARRRADRFSPALMAARYRDTYDELLAGAPLDHARCAQAAT